MIELLDYILALAQLLLICFTLYREVIRKTPSVFLWATLLIMFGIPHFLAVVSNTSGYSRNVTISASLFSILFIILYLFFRSKRDFLFLKVEDDRVELQSNVNNTLFEKICFMLFIISMVYMILFVIVNQGGILKTSWESARNISGNYVSISGLARRIVFTFSGLSLYYFYMKKYVKSAMVVLLFLLWVLITRNRVQIIPALVFPIVLVILRVKEFKFNYVVAAAAIGLIVLYVVYGIQAFRYLGSLADALDKFSLSDLNSRIASAITSGDGELGLYKWFYYFISRDNQFTGFNKGYTYIRMLLVYLPSRLSFGLKPEGFDLYMGQAAGMSAGGSMHPTLFGDCFANLYWYGVLLGALWAVICNWVESIINRKKDDYFKIMVYFLASYSFVVIGRGSVYNGFEVFAWGILILFLFEKVLYNSTGFPIKIKWK